MKPNANSTSFELQESASLLPERVKKYREELRVAARAFIKWSLIILPLFLYGLTFIAFPDEGKLTYRSIAIGGVETVVGGLTGLWLVMRCLLLPRFQKELLTRWRLTKRGVFAKHGSMAWRKIRLFQLRSNRLNGGTGELVLESKVGKTFTLVFDTCHTDMEVLRAFLSQRVPPG